MMKIHIIFGKVAFILVLCWQTCQAIGSVGHRRLKYDLLENYDSTMKPDGKVFVKVSIQPKRLDLNANTEVLELLSFNAYEWVDDRLAWDPDFYDHITSLFLDESNVWIPDVTFLHEIEAPKPLKPVYKVFLVHDGTVIFMPAVVQKVFCKPNFMDWPFGEQNCTFKVGSFHYSIHDIDIQPRRSSSSAAAGINEDEFPLMDQIEILESSIWRDKNDFHSGTSYPHVKVSLRFKRNKLFKDGQLLTQ